MTPRPLSLALAAGLGVAILAGGGAALAQPSPESRAAAAALFEDGIRLMAEGKPAEACPKLEESQRIDPGMGTLYRLSLCFEENGRTASAWVGFREVAGLAQAAGQGEREKAARGKASALETRLMRLKITMAPSPGSAAVEVKRDGAVVSPALWGTPVPLDPGRHKVSASAPGKDPWEVTVQLEQPGSTVSVDVPPLLEKRLSPAPTVDRLPAGPIAPPGPASPPSSPSETRGARAWQLPLGIAATVVGAAGLGVGTAFGFLAKSGFDQSNSSGNCDPATGTCNPAGLGQRSSAVNKGNLGTGVFVAGAVVAGGGIVIWATAPSRASASAQVGLGVGPASASLRGSF